MSHQSKADLWEAILTICILVIVLLAIAWGSLMVYDYFTLRTIIAAPDMAECCCCCPTQGAADNFLLLPSASSTPTPTSTTEVTITSQPGITRTPSRPEPTFTPRPTRTPRPRPTHTQTPTYVPPTPVPTTPVPSGLAHWHLKNDNAKLYCVYSEKGHKPNIEWYVDYEACMDAAEGH